MTRGKKDTAIHIAARCRVVLTVCVCVMYASNNSPTMSNHIKREKESQLPSAITAKKKKLINKKDYSKLCKHVLLLVFSRRWHTNNANRRSQRPLTKQFISFPFIIEND